MSSILGVPACYHLTYDADAAMWIVWLNHKSLMSFKTKTQAENYAKMHSKLNKEN